jgi:hypothetical protein
MSLRVALVTAAIALPSTASASSGLTRKLWILNQSGDPHLADFFTCVLGTTNWNDLANTYSAGETLVLGGQVQRNDDPCTANVGSPAFYQCAVDAGKFDVTAWDVVLVVYPDSGYGGQNGTATVTNPVSGASVTVNSAHVTTSPDPIYQTIYGGHEVFEAQTDGVSADCCDGETASGGPMNWCSQCGPFDNGHGACGQYAPGGAIGTLGIDTIACPTATFHYQRVSPADHEFDGTCTAIAPVAGAADPCGNVAAADNGTYCGSSTQSGFGSGKPGVLYDCENGFVASTTKCPYGCFIAAAGMADGCNAAPVADAGAEGGPHDGGTAHGEGGAHDGGGGGSSSGGGASSSGAGGSGGQDASGGGAVPLPEGGTGATGDASLDDSQGGGGGSSGGCSVARGSDGSGWLLGLLAAAVARRARRGARPRALA